MHKVYKLKKNKMKTILLNCYEKKFGIDKFENIHSLLDTNKLNEDEKKFYNVPIQLFGKTDRDSPFVKYFYNLFDTDYNILYLIVTQTPILGYIYISYIYYYLLE